VAHDAPKPTVIATSVTSITPGPAGRNGDATGDVRGRMSDGQRSDARPVPEGKEHQVEPELVEEQGGRGDFEAPQECPSGQRGPGQRREPLSRLGRHVGRACLVTAGIALALVLSALDCR
jgi:hypothetical protein